MKSWNEIRMDHLCNLEVADRFGQYFARIPIKASPHIVCTDALTFDWRELLTTDCTDFTDGRATSMKSPHFDYIFGNPPFLGFTYMSAEQKQDMLTLFPKNKNLDFVCGWYKKTNDLIQGADTHCAFVSTNSITQGEQVAPLWKNLNVEIDFAYRTFKWSNEAKGPAAVHCVIIGFHAPNSTVGRGVPSAPQSRSNEKVVDSGLRRSGTDRPTKTIFDGSTPAPATHINGYLCDAPDVTVESRSKAICDVPMITVGNRPNDDGNLIIEHADYSDFITREPKAVPHIKKIIGSKEFINNLPRHCLWLKDAPPSDLREMPLVMERVAKCKAFRLASVDAGARKLAARPTLFRETNNPKSAIVIPKVSSEKRDYIPIGFIDDSIIVSDLLFLIPDATLYHFGVLTSRMHNAWMRAVAGRLKSDYRYSKDIVYNNFVWPTTTPEQQAKIVEAAQAILDARKLYEGQSLADLYDPLFMPPELVKAHAKLDALVDKAYGRTFANDAERVAHLFNLYAEAVKS